MRTAVSRNFLAVLCLLVMAPSLAVAQQASGCVATELSDPPRIVYQCANGLVLEAEAAAALEIEEAIVGERPDAVRLTEKGVLIELVPGNGSFQILTPHAIAAVRGTIYVVDVMDGMTSVFVVSGEIAVSRTDRSETVALAAGDGIEVSLDQPMIVELWQPEKVARLLARFGR